MPQQRLRGLTNMKEAQHEDCDPDILPDVRRSRGGGNASFLSEPPQGIGKEGFGTSNMNLADVQSW